MTALRELVWRRWQRDLPAELRTARIVVGFSGGLDSTVLLHLLVSLRDSGVPLTLEAVHVNHGLSANADTWQQRALAVSSAWDVPLYFESVALNDDGRGLEAAARQARYRVFDDRLKGGGVLACAHHRDDQVETFMLNLLRGSGSRGLSAMPLLRALGEGQLWRPLLMVSRLELEEYAGRHGLSYVDDESNADVRFARNHWRHDLLPPLRRAYPQFDEQVSCSAALLADEQQALSELAEFDWQQCRIDAGLDIAALQLISRGRRRNLLRFWSERCSGVGLGIGALQQLEETVLKADMDAQPQLRHAGGWMRRYRQQLVFCEDCGDDDVPRCVDWYTSQPLAWNGGCLKTEPSDSGLRHFSHLQVQQRSGGERIRPAGRGVSKTLKQLLKEHGVPTWQRDRVPLLYHGNDLVAVVGICIAEGYVAGDGEPAMRVVFQIAS